MKALTKPRPITRTSLKSSWEGVPVRSRRLPSLFRALEGKNGSNEKNKNKIAQFTVLSWSLRHLSSSLSPHIYDIEISAKYSIEVNGD